MADQQKGSFLDIIFRWIINGFAIFFLIPLLVYGIYDHFNKPSLEISVNEGSKETTKNNFDSEGRKHGIWSEQQQGLSIEGNYKNGIKEGKWLTFHTNGNKWMEFYYKNGKKNGKSYTWHPQTGVLIGETEYKNDNSYGTWKSYYEGGKNLKLIMKFPNGIKTEEIHFDKKGNILTRALYKDGKLISIKEPQKNQ